MKLKKETERLKRLSAWDVKRLVNELGTHQIELETQTDELRRTLEELEVSHRKYADLYDFAPVGYFNLDENGLILEVNRAGAVMLGELRSHLIGKTLSRFFDSSAHVVFQKHLGAVRASDIGQTCELTVKRKDGSTFCASVRSICSTDTPGFRSVMTDTTEASIARDELTKAKSELEKRVQERTEELAKTNRALQAELAERERAEEAVRRALGEKETLLREIHHRVKNNLQVVSSLLDLQSQKIEDAGLREMFQESQLRVKSMAMVHEKMYQTRSLSAIDFRDYIATIIAELSSFYNAWGRKITTTVDIAPMALNLDLAIPCALIINELLTNAYRHAFTGRGGGDVRIGFHEIDGGCTLSVADNGVGLPEIVDWRRASSLGFQLITVLVKQLNGAVDVLSTNGVTVTITFRCKEAHHGKA